MSDEIKNLMNSFLLEFSWSDTELNQVQNANLKLSN